MPMSVHGCDCFFSQVVRKGEDAKAHKELNNLGGDTGGEKEVDTGKAQNALSKVILHCLHKYGMQCVHTQTQTYIHSMHVPT